MGGFWTGVKASIGDAIAGAVLSILVILFGTFIGRISLSMNSLEGIALILVGAIIALTIKGIVLGILWGWE